MNSSNYIVFDFETDGTNPLKCQPIQIAAKVINPRSLDPYPDAEFNSLIKPDFDTLDMTALEINKITVDQLKEAPSPKIVWRQFVAFCKQYDVVEEKRTKHPIPVGYNIQSYDLKIVERLNKEYNKGKNIFAHFSVDLLHIYFLWFESNPMVANLRFDTLRNFFDLPTEGAHNAIVDVRQCAELFIQQLKLYREVGKKIKWK